MANRVNLDAMIPREDFGRADEEEFVLDLFRDFPISNLDSGSPILKLLRKPDFQRETNHWSPEQIATFVASFLDNEVIPSLILWKSPTHIFVIDGGHRLSALRAWIADDYGDRGISINFYKGEIPEDQKRVAKRARLLVEQRVGRFSTLQGHVENRSPTDIMGRRARLLFTRALNLQWIQGNASVAETSFFKINSQGTPLDETETMLIKNRRKPVAIAARAIIRSGGGHKYWSAFPKENQEQVEKLSEKLFQLLFKPEADTPLKTFDVPVGGSVSPVDALSLLIELLTLTADRRLGSVPVDKYEDDVNGEGTIRVLSNTIDVLRRITGNHASSLGLHTGVYFYNERGKYTRFLFLGFVLLIAEKLRDNDTAFFRKFTMACEDIEVFLITNKSLMGIILQNLSKSQRVAKMRDLFSFLVSEARTGRPLTPEATISHLGLFGRFYDINSMQSNVRFSDDTKSMLYIRSALQSALKCPLCRGLLEPRKSVSYDHVVPVREGGLGEPENGQLVHPYCNTGLKN